MRRILWSSLAVLLLAGVVVTAGGATTSAKPRWSVAKLPFCWANDVNDRGQVVGGDDGRPVLWEKGRTRRLVVPGRATGATAINKLGQVLISAVEIEHSYLWHLGRLTDLGEFSARDVNDRGQVVGWASGDETQEHAVLWQGGKLRDLGTLGGDRSYAFGINNRGQIVGGSWTKSGDLRAFLWQDGKMRDLGTLGGGESRAFAINERGHVVGWAEPDASETMHAFVWQSGKMRDLGVLPQGPRTSMVAWDINDRDEVVGFGEVPSDDSDDPWPAWQHALVWRGGKMIDLGTPFGGPRSAPTAINNRGQIVGWSGTLDSCQGVLWTLKP